MAEVSQKKSRGLKFAEQQLLRHGWEQGKGLGRAENGISEAIKVKVKCDKGGVGHKEGEQFTFHWWDHVFNKASSNLQVESDQNGVQLKKTEKDEEDGMISNKKPRKAMLAKEKLYGCFVKSATLLSGEEQPEPKSSNSDDSSNSEDEVDQKLDLLSTIKLSDADLMKACGGRTAHKGARHGLTMSAKLARLEQQEAEFMARYGKKTEKDLNRKLTKKKKSDESVNEPNGGKVAESPDADVKPKKNKKKYASEDTEETTDAVSTEGDAVCLENSATEHSHKKKSKRKKKKNNVEQSQTESPEESAELHVVTKAKKKKRNKEEESKNTQANHSQLVEDCVTKNEKKKSAVLLEEVDIKEEEATVKHKKKKCKKNKSVEDINEEALPPKKKKKSKD